MTDPVVAFLLGPIYFLYSIGTYSPGSMEGLQTFIASGLGTTFWAVIADRILEVVS